MKALDTKLNEHSSITSIDSSSIIVLIKLFEKSIDDLYKIHNTINIKTPLNEKYENIKKEIQTLIDFADNKSTKKY